MIPWKLTFAGIRDYAPAYLDLSGHADHIMITGPNGAGKSTITYCMGAVLYSSKVEVEGLKSRNLPPDETWRARISLLFLNEGSIKIDAPRYIEFTLILKQEPGEPIKKEFIIESGDEQDHYTDRKHYTSGDRENSFTKYKRDLQYVYRIDPDLFYLIWYQQEVNQFATMSPEERFRIFSEMHGITDAQRNWEESMVKLKETRESLSMAQTRLAGTKQNLKIMKSELDRYEQNRKRLRDGGILRSVSLLRLEKYFKQERAMYLGQAEQLLLDQEEQKEKVDGLIEEKQNLDAQRIRCDEDKERVTGEIFDLEQKLQNLQEDKDVLKTEIAGLKQELAMLEEERKYIQRTEAQVTKGLEDVYRRLTELTEQEQVNAKQTLEVERSLSDLRIKSSELKAALEQDEKEESLHRDILSQHSSSHEVQLEMNRLEEKIRTGRNHSYDLDRELKVLERELENLRMDRNISVRQQASLQYFQRLGRKAYTLSDLIELDEAAHPKHEDAFNTIKYTIFFSGSGDGIKPPNDLYHVPLHSVVPDRSVTVLPSLHLKVKRDLSEEMTNDASKALWWVERFFLKHPVRIEEEVLRDAAGLRGNQEQPRYILSARALEVRKKQVESNITKLSSELEQINQLIQEDTQRSQILGGIIQQVRMAEAFMTREHERIQRREQLQTMIIQLSGLENEQAQLSKVFRDLMTVRVELEYEQKILEKEAAFYKKLGAQSEKFERLNANENLLRLLESETQEKEDEFKALEDQLEQLEKRGRKLERDDGEAEHRLQLTKQQLQQLNNQLGKAREGKQDAEAELTALARLIEDMKGIVPEIFNEAKQIYAEKYAKEENAVLKALRTEAEKGEVTFEQARKEEVDPAAPENYRIAKENYEQLEDEYKRTVILLEADEQRTTELQDLLETTISMRVGEVQQKFRSYMSLFQFEGQVDWDSHQDKQGRTHFHLYIRARKEGHRGKLEDVSIKARGGRVGKGVSGGEESLSSLLFALSLLQNLQSNPGFIVLDEFDSALDEQRKNMVFDLYVRELKRKMIILTPKSHEPSYFERFNKAYVVYHNPLIPRSQVIGLQKKEQTNHQVGNT
ncbi:AAA family ATPase [Paenibacillus sp. FSL W8-0194]|uniref:AAA family ATPase n=1 Tax=Paenibacillus sp. FSL W8-0194 TaxID=2921711 RepID=UPI0030D819CE